MRVLRHGVLLGACLGAAALTAEILISRPYAEEAGLALRWIPAYCIAGAVLGVVAALLAPMMSGAQARERGPGILLLGTMVGLVILLGTFLPGLILDNSLPPLAKGVLGVGVAAGVHMLGVAAAGAASAWRVESFVSAFSAGAWLGVLLILTSVGAWILPGHNPTDAAGAAGAARAGSQPLNVALIVLDGVRADHLGCLGSFRAASPRFDALAGESVLFERAFAASPDHPASLTRLLGGAEHPLAPALAREGWQTWAVTADPGALQGFTRQEDVIAGQLHARLLLARWIERIRARVTAVEEPRMADQVVERALELAAGRDPQQPFFLVAHLSDATPPYDPPAELRTRFLPDGLSPADLLREVEGQDALRLAMIAGGHQTASPAEAQAFSALYDAEILAQDAALGRFVDGLLDLGLLEDTLLIVAADHGTRLGEEEGRLGSAGALHDAVLRVPLLLRLPRLLPAGTRAAGLVSLDDVAPAIRALVGGTRDARLLAAAHGGSPRRSISAWIREDGELLQLVRGEHEKILLDPRGQILAAGDLLADPDESFLRLRLRAPLDPAAAARWRQRARELSEESAAGTGGNGDGLGGG